MATATKTKPRSALDATEDERGAARERLEDLAQRTEAARVGLSRELGAAEKRVRDLEADREKRKDKYRAAEAVLVEKTSKAYAERSQELRKTLAGVTRQHLEISSLHDALLMQLARVKDTLA